MTKLFDENGKHEVTRCATTADGDIIITLDYTNTITVRRKGKRTAYSTSILAVYNLALIEADQDRYNKAMVDYHRKKKAGYKRLRVPGKPNAACFFNPKFSLALKQSNN